MAHDSHIDHPEQRHSDVRHYRGQRYLQYLTVSLVHIGCKVKHFFGACKKFD
jgi:hypothetical protein